MSDDEMSVPQSLLSELRRARSVAGLSQEGLGKAINYSSSLVSAVENGQRPATRDYLVSVDKALSTGGLFERLLSTLVSIEQAPVWFRDWLKVERDATLIRWFEPIIVPGLLQTRAYAHAIIAGARLVGEAEVKQLVATRMQRQGLLAWPKPPDLIAIIDEGVLRRKVGGADVMAAQCEHLLACAEQPAIQIHVVPAEAGAYAGLAGAFALAKGSDFETAHLETPWQSRISDQQNVVHSLIRRWEGIRGEALPRSQSTELIKEVARTWQS